MDSNLVKKNHKKANNQLINIDCKKSKIKKEIYILYDLYLKIIRSKLQNYIGEAIKSLVKISDKGISVKHRKIKLFLRNDLKNLINKIKPFLTIEQLSIKKEYKVSIQTHRITEFRDNYHLNEEVYTINNSKSINKLDSTKYVCLYYKNLIDEDNNYNIDLDNCISESKAPDFLRNYKKLQFNNSQITISENDEDKLSLNIAQNIDSKYFVPIEFKDLLIWIETLEYSLNYYLKDLSIEINNQLFKKDILNKFVNNESLHYVFENHLLFSSPSPFILSFDPSLNQYINFEEIYSESKFSKINLINIDSTEFEFININLSLLKNKLLHLKYNINSLIKKEDYWCNKLKANSSNLSIINKL